MSGAHKVATKNTWNKYYSTYMFVGQASAEPSKIEF